MKCFLFKVPSSSYCNQLHADGTAWYRSVSLLGTIARVHSKTALLGHVAALWNPGHGDFQSQVAGPYPSLQAHLELNYLTSLSLSHLNSKAPGCPANKPFSNPAVGSFLGGLCLIES